MRIRHEISFAWAVLVVVQALTLAGAVGLLARMTPAIGRIMTDNEYSIEAVETMLVEVGAPAHDEGARARFETALAAARANVTEPDEPERLDRIERAHAAAFEGNPIAREQVVGALRELSRINRRAMAEAAARASDLGRTGAWAAAVLGLVSIASAIGVARRLERRVVDPVESVAAAASAIGAGDVHRRCPARGPSEVVALGHGIEALRGRPTAEPPRERDERRLLLALLDGVSGAAFLVGPNGAILHANVEGTRALLEEPSVLAAIRAAWQDAPADWSHTPLPDGVSLVRAPAGLGMHPAAPSRA